MGAFFQIQLRPLFGAIAVMVCLGILLAQCSEENTPTSLPVEKTLRVEPNPETGFSHAVITDQLTVPWQMDFAEDGRIFITERQGLVRIVKDNRLEERPWLDLRDSLRTPFGATVGNAGLLGLALDPGFSSNGYVYLGYSYNAPGEPYDYNRLVRYKEDSATGLGIFDKILLDKMKGRSMHNSGPIKFGPDGKLYWAIGDRGQAELAQSLDDEAGKILRLNPDGTLPEDNPFPGSAIFAFGLRNVQGFDWHPASGMMLATDHGPSSEVAGLCCRDEVNIIEAGKNYGWPVIMAAEERGGMQTPFIHSDAGTPIEHYTWAPAGAAFVHTGEWEGSFLFAGLRSQRLWKLVIDEEKMEPRLTYLLHGEYGRIRSVGQSPSGSIYMITSNLDTSPQGTREFEHDYLIELTPAE